MKQFYIVQAYAEIRANQTEPRLGSVKDGVTVQEFGTNWPLAAENAEQAAVFLAEAWKAGALPGRAIFRLSQAGQPAQTLATLAVDEQGSCYPVTLSRRDWRRPRWVVSKLSSAAAAG